MTKEEKDSSVGWTYGGKEEEWDAFDRRMTRYMRNKLDSFGEKMWQGQIGDLKEFKEKELQEHVLSVYNLLRVTKPKEEKELWKKGSDFFKKCWHVAWLSRQANLMVDHV
jgi:hypothetical protein